AFRWKSRTCQGTKGRLDCTGISIRERPRPEREDRSETIIIPDPERSRSCKSPSFRAQSRNRVTTTARFTATRLFPTGEPLSEGGCEGEILRHARRLWASPRLRMTGLLGW